jgi:hypothetical protein
MNLSHLAAPRLEVEHDPPVGWNMSAQPSLHIREVIRVKPRGYAAMGLLSRIHGDPDPGDLY